MIALLFVALLPRPVFPQASDPQAKFRLASSLEQGGEFARAAGLYEELLARDTSNVVLFDALQRVYIQLKRYDDAITLIRRRLATDPKNTSLLSQLGSTLYRAGREKDADEAWNAAIDTDPGNPAIYRMVAGVLIENRLLEKAATVYRTGRVACNDPRLFTMEFVQLLVASMDYAGATAEYLRWLGDNPAQLSFVQSRMAGFTGKDDARNAAISAVRSASEKAKTPTLFELLGWLYMEGKDFTRALDVYRTMDNMTQAHGQALFGFAEKALKNRAFDAAAEGYKESLDASLAPDRRAAAEYGYARALLESAATADTARWPLPSGQPSPTGVRDEYGAAIARFRAIIDAYPRTDFAAMSYYQIGTLQCEKYNDLDAALASFEQIRQIPGLRNLLEYDVILKIGNVLTVKGDTTAAKPLFSRIAAAPAATPDQIDEARYLLAQADYFSGRFPEAMRRLDSIAINLKADYANDALMLKSFMSENASTDPEALRLFAHADFLGHCRKNTEAIALFLDAVKRYPQSLLADDALLKAGDIQARTGLYADAIASYDRLLDEYKETSGALDRAEMGIAEVCQYGLRDPMKAVAEYEKLLADHPQSLLAGQARERVRRLRGDTM